ncbi:MAG: hypothetical protein ACOYW4_05335, partial [Bacillota bacterium]
VVQGVRSLKGKVNLASEFQMDSSGFACQGKGSISLEEARFDGAFTGVGGLGQFDAAGQGVVEFWQKPGEHLSFEGHAELKTPSLSAGDAVRNALGVDAGSLKVDGPVALAVAFAGRAPEGVAIHGRLDMSGGQVVAEGLSPAIARIAGDLGCRVEFARSPEGELTYSGKVRSAKASVKTGRIAGAAGFEGDAGVVLTFEGSAGKIESYRGTVKVLEGSADATYPAAGLEYIRGGVSGSMDIAGAAGGTTTYSGVVRLADARAVVAARGKGVESFETGADGTLEFDGEYPGKARLRGAIDLQDGALRVAGSLGGAGSGWGEGRTRGKIIFSGEYPGRIRCEGTVDVSRGAVRVQDGPRGLKRLEVSAEGRVGFQGELPGKVQFQSSWTLPGGAVEIAGGPGGLKSAAGSIAGSVDFRGNLSDALEYRPGEFEYNGHLDLKNASVDLAE